MTKRALILGIGGMDGSFLAELLLEKQYEVHGLVRRSSCDNLWRIRHILDRVTLHQGDLSDPLSIHRAIRSSNPELLFNMADQDHVGWSYVTPAYSMDITAGAVGRLLESVRMIDSSIKVFQPVSATMFGSAAPPQSEQTPLDPQSPYAIAKAAAFHLCRYYRQTHDMFISTGIMFNHDSERRQGDYLLHKICRGAVAIARGKQKTLPLGCLSMRVDIGYAPEYVEAAWRMLQQETPDDFVIATGENWSILEMAREAFKQAGVATVPSPLEHDQTFMRPGAEPRLVGSTARTRDVLGWEVKTGVREVIHKLIRHYQEQPCV